MLPKTNDGAKRIEKYLLENATPEVKPIPKKDEKPKEETPKNDEYNEYDYSDKQTTQEEDAGNW